VTRGLINRAEKCKGLRRERQGRRVLVQYIGRYAASGNRVYSMSSKRPAPYLNIVRFPIPLEFHNSALGLRRRVVIGRLRGTLMLPLPNIDAIEVPFSGLLPPRAKNIDLAQRVYAQGVGGEPDVYVDWGRYFTWHKDRPAETAVASVRLAALSFPQAQPQGVMSLEEVAEECLNHIVDWCSRLVDWIEVLTGDDLDAAHPIHSALDRAPWTSTPWIYVEGDAPQYQFVNPVLRLYGSRGDNAIGPREWSTVIRSANAGRDLPEAWSLLRDARAAYRRDHGRRAVLDAATAAELIIDRQLRAKLLRRNDPPFVDKLLKGTWQVSRRLELMSALGMWLPADIDTKLSSLRNRVVHSNASVTKSDAAAAVDVAEQLARRYEPNALKLVGA
jgi:hypothetical protein